MLRLVATNNDEVLQHLERRDACSFDIEHTVVSSYQAALDGLVTVQPDVALIHPEFADGTGFDLCRMARSDPKLRDTYIVMVISSAMTPTVLDTIAASGCNDVLALPIQADDFYYHIARLVGYTVGEALRASTQDPLAPDDSEDALYEISPAPDDSPLAGGVCAALHGDFNELTSFYKLARALESASQIVFDMANVRYISSVGLRGWCQLINTVARKRHAFRRCSMTFITQAAMVPMVLGAGDVMSLEAPYLCEQCDREQIRILYPASLHSEGEQHIPPQFTCRACGGELVFDDAPERYFAFLHPDARAARAT